MGRTLRMLLAGRMLGMVIEGVATWVALAVYGVPMAALLGLLTGLLVFLPNIGAPISGLLMILVGFSEELMFRGVVLRAGLGEVSTGQAILISAVLFSLLHSVNVLAFVPLDGMLRTVARRITDSFRDIPHFPLTIDLEIDALLAARAKINAMLEKDGVKVSVNDMVIKAVATALKRVPAANASYTPEGLAMHHHADIAVAVALEHGLITPIIRSAETKGLAQIAVEAKDLASRARSKKLKPEEFQGGTFSISNLGMFGIKSFNSILNEPQGCILSVGAGEQRPVVKDGQLAVATVMSVTLTCDHRVVDGAIGARFLQVFKAMIEDPLTMIV
jgi:pyruvate dehydrogenase complex dihydrolipoamide acetyltransferase long form